MNVETFISILNETLRAATPIIFAATGELIAEKSGVLNLGVEGMMLVGAVTGFITSVVTGNVYLGLLIAILAGMLIALIHALLVISINANQIASGLALSIFGSGLSAFIGAEYIDKTIIPLQPVGIPIFKSIPIIGVLFNQDILVYTSIFSIIFVSWFLSKTRAGLILRSIGESPQSAQKLGLKVSKIRYLSVIFGGVMAGLAGSYLSLVYTPLWAENITSGKGWIAIALVTFAAWKPARILIGAYLFGGISAIQLTIKAIDINISPLLSSCLPYLATILLLIIISRDETRLKLQAPASLGEPFRSDS